MRTKNARKSVKRNATRRKRKEEDKRNDPARRRKNRKKKKKHQEEKEEKEAKIQRIYRYLCKVSNVRKDLITRSIF